MDNTDNDISFLRFQEISTLIISKKNTTLSKTKYLLLETNNSIRTPKITGHSDLYFVSINSKYIYAIILLTCIYQSTLLRQ